MSKPLNIYMLPFFAGGHLIPMFNFARLMVSRGHHVTIITTPSNAQLFDKTTIEDDTCFHVHIIRFPSNQVDLPVGVENLLDSYDDQTVGKILMATNLIEPEIKAFMKKRAPDIFIPDMIFTWSETLAKSLGIPTLIFNPISIFVFCMIESVKSSSLLPLPYNINPDPSFIKFSESMMENVKKSHGVIVNSFPELEVEYTQHYEKLINNGCKVWQIGPISLMIQKTLTKVDEEKNDEYYLSWLNSKEQESVVYICFGSMCLISDEQFFEIARGIEASGHQFLWVVQNKLDKTPLPLPEGFEEKMRKDKRGMVIKGWAPQTVILNHPAIGAFLSHCGWNAILETIGAGVPMITMPMYTDQYYNEKLVTEVRGFGVEVGEAEWSPTPYDPNKKVVSGVSIEKAVNKLMDGGDESWRIRGKAKELQEKAFKSVQEGGSSHNALTTLIDHLSTLLPNPTPTATAS